VLNDYLDMDPTVSLNWVDKYRTYLKKGTEAEDVPQELLLQTELQLQTKKLKLHLPDIIKIQDNQLFMELLQKIYKQTATEVEQKEQQLEPCFTLE
jgi:hypothetical protein